MSLIYRLQDEFNFTTFLKEVYIKNHNQFIYYLLYNKNIDTDFKDIFCYNLNPFTCLGVNL